ncbi:MAG TPA: OmpA family protein [Spirochaetota bacterium]|nr:OmpA family protein [Spirochaetota bacterium]
MQKYLFIFFLIGASAGRADSENTIDMEALQEAIEAIEEGKDKYEKTETNITGKKGEVVQKKKDKTQQDWYHAKKYFIKGKKQLVIGYYQKGRALFKQSLDLFPTNADFQYFYKLTFFPEVELTSATNKVYYKGLINLPIQVKYSRGPVKLSNWIKRWKLEITDTNFTNVYIASGSNRPPPRVEWRFTTNELVPAVYTAKMTLFGDYYCKFTTDPYKINMIYKRKLTADVWPRKKSFYPGREVVPVGISCNFPERIKNWELIFKNADGNEVCRYQGKDFTNKVIWTGKDKQSNYVEEGNEFWVYAQGIENDSDPWETGKKKIKAKIFVKKEGEEISFALSSIHFDFEKATLRPTALIVLDNAARILEEYPDKYIILKGHTDSVGGDLYNLDLSKRRTWSVLNYLINHKGFSPARILAFGYGERQPVVPNTTPAKRQKNRRVEFVLTDEKGAQKYKEDDNENYVPFTDYNADNYTIARITSSEEKDMKQQQQISNRIHRYRLVVNNENIEPTTKRRLLKWLLADIVYLKGSSNLIKAVTNYDFDYQVYYKAIAYFHLMKITVNTNQGIRYMSNALKYFRKVPAVTKENRLAVSARFWEARTLTWALEYGIRNNKMVDVYNTIITKYPGSAYANDSIFHMMRIYKVNEEMTMYSNYRQRLLTEKFSDNYIADYISRRKMPLKLIRKQLQDGDL